MLKPVFRVLCPISEAEQRVEIKMQHEFFTDLLKQRFCISTISQKSTLRHGIQSWNTRWAGR